MDPFAFCLLTLSSDHSICQDVQAHQIPERKLTYSEPTMNIQWILIFPTESLCFISRMPRKSACVSLLPLSSFSLLTPPQQVLWSFLTPPSPGILAQFRRKYTRPMSFWLSSRIFLALCSKQRLYVLRTFQRLQGMWTLLLLTSVTFHDMMSMQVCLKRISPCSLIGEEVGEHPARPQEEWGTTRETGGSCALLPGTARSCNPECDHFSDMPSTGAEAWRSEMGLPLATRRSFNYKVFPCPVHTHTPAWGSLLCRMFYWMNRWVNGLHETMVGWLNKWMKR